MEDLNKVIKSVKESVTVDNIVNLMKEAKVIDEKRLKEEDVRKTLSKMDINKYLDVEEIKKQAHNVAEQSKDTIKDIQDQSSKVLSYAKESFKEFNLFKVLSKTEVGPDSACGNPVVHPPDIIEKQDHDCNSNHKIQNKAEAREEDACKMESQGKQYDAAPNQGMDNTLEVSAIANVQQKSDI